MYLYEHRISKRISTSSRNYCQRLMILRINKVNLIPVYRLPQKGEWRKGQKEIHSLLEITNKEREKIQRVKHLINSLRQAGCIDEMAAAKWFNQTTDPPRIPVFYTLTKIHKPTLVERPIISGCDGPTERLSSFVDKLLQPIAQMQESYLKVK